MIWTDSQIILLYKEMCYDGLMHEGIFFIDKIAKDGPQFIAILGEVIKEGYPQYLEYFNKIAILI